MIRTKSLWLSLSACIAPVAMQAQVVDSIPAHTRFVIHSRVLHEDRVVNVHTPVGYEWRHYRYQVLYMPDGGLDEDFPHVVNTVDSLIALQRIPPTIVVGILNTERRRDLTGPTRVKSDSAIAPHVGGSAAFRRFIRTELMPEIRHRYRTSRTTAVVGESLAGLFIVETYLREPKLFDRYIALSPSLWWNANALVREAPTLAPRVGKYTTLFLSAANEPGIQENSATLAGILRTWLPMEAGFAYEPRPDLEHATIFRGEGPAAMAEALRHYLGGGNDDAEWQGYSLAARCGLPGLELRGIRHEWGSPDSVRADSSGATWLYNVGKLQLRLQIANGVIRTWGIVGPVTPRALNKQWRNLGREGAAARVPRYLSAHPETSPTIAYALYRGCVQPGMSEAEAVATLGDPNERRPSPNGVTLVYGFGIEGQYTWARLEHGVVVAFGESGGADEDLGGPP